MPADKKIRVLIVDDSAIVRKTLSDIINSEDGLEVAGTAADPFVARDKILALKPDVLTLDIEMPRMDGLTFLKKLMRFHPMPVVVISSLGHASSQAAIEALQSGAVDVEAKPGGPHSVSELRQELARKIHAAAEAHLRRNGSPTAQRPRPPTLASARAHGNTAQVIGIGASTGGVEALRCVLMGLPEQMPPIVVVQHIPPVFSAEFARRLDKTCRLRVKEAVDGDALEPGLALVAPGNFHLTGTYGDEMEKRAGEIAAITRKLVVLAGEEAMSATTSARWIAGVMILQTLIIWAVAIAIVFRINNVLRSATAQLAEGSEQISGAASQVASSSQSLAQGASEQAASLEETSASSEEITSMTRKNSENSQSAADVMATVDQHVKEGNRTLEQMVVSMAEINSSSDKISKIIKVIDEIAFQTNILALNAAVEAARAGEAGMGFAVVADEVRNLAQRSAQAAKDTAGLIEESIAKSNEGSSKLQQVTEVIRAITESSSKVKTLVDEVNLGSQEQARGIDQIAKAVSQMDQVTQSTAANAEESASASEELSAQAEALNQIVMQLQALVGGDSEQHGGAVASTHRRPAPAVPVHKRSLNALKSAVSRPKARARVEAAVPAGRPDRSSFPLEDNFTEM